jgi:hypothetical protein
MKKIIGAACAVFTGLALLTGCPADTILESGESYIDEAVLVHEKAKYRTVAVFNFDESNAGEDVTDEFIQPKPGKTADHTVLVSVYNTDGSGYFTVQDGRILFTGVMPLGEFEKDDGDYEPEEDEESIEKAGISNGEVITLLFQKGDASATLEVLGIIEEKGGEVDEERIAISPTTTFLLYGYDVISSAYINRDDVKKTRPILDVDKVNGTKLNGTKQVEQSSIADSRWESFTGTSVSELMENLNASLNVGYSGVMFSGKVETEFSISSNSKKTTQYAKGRGFHRTREEFLQNTSPSILKTLLHDTFVSDINTQDAAYILKYYGTHLITRCYWGGEAEFNYSYTGTELTSEQDIKVALNASYGGFSGEASTEAKTKATELNSNSSLLIVSRGGRNTSFMTVEQFNAGYDAWVESIAANPDLCGIPSFEDSLVPIWTIAAEVNRTKADQILEEYTAMADARGIALAGFTYTPPEKVYTYVTDINVIEQKNWEPPSGWTALVRPDMYNPNASNALDANSYAGGASIRIAYRTVAQSHNHEAIAEVRVVNTGNYPHPPDDRSLGFTSIEFDLNKGAGGPYLWLQYRKVQQGRDNRAIDFIGGYDGVSASSGVILPGYEWVHGPSGPRINLNQGTRKGRYVHLTVHYSPFEW